ncbi:hypothetical protein BXZ70DRAFT_348114 [Cristinia sonorae]|uniref:Mediator of RNA polymerase II transcription subunit 11 n=1 Tax=Cristinia sonorae TaxID=1940300 RepID=A0A8K0UKI7_9AGAR|nr:hypothetical protein BXZ70DRAFT_348114 [Cristinia sonorae]
MASNGTKPDSSQQNTNGAGEIDPVWMSSRTARQIYALSEVEEGISRLLSLAASSISLLTLPQTDNPEDGLPQGGERSEQFVLEASEYFERLDQIHIAIRSSLAHIRQSRIAPSAINAPPPNFIPPSLGVGMPSADASDTSAVGSEKGSRGLQEDRVERDAWVGVLNALTRLKEARALERVQEREREQEAARRMDVSQSADG